MAKLLNKKTLIGCLVTVGLFEVLLSFWTGLPYDMQVWFKTGLWMQQGINIYVPSNHIGYPPLWAFWCSISYRIFLWLGNNMPVWRLTIKLPLIIAQFALAYAMGLFVANRFGQKVGRQVFFIALIWSFIIYISALWGQINVLSTFFTFLAFYLTIKERYNLGALSLGLAITLKITPIFILPLFAIYILRKSKIKVASKFVLISCALPVVFTLSVFAVYNWDITYFFRTIFYSTSVGITPTQISGGCMNIWSFVALFGFDIAKYSVLRLVWIPVVVLGYTYWFRKQQMTDTSFTFSIISIYFLFMLSYGWVTEQTFLDVLPFIFLFIIAYKPSKPALYGLAIVQLFVFGFSLFNWGPFIFQPLIEQFYPSLLPSIELFDPSKSSLLWDIRGIFGLLVTIAFSVYLIMLSKLHFKPTSVSAKNA